MNKFPTCLNFLFLSLSRMYPMFKKNQMRKNNRRLSRYNTRDIIAQSSPKLDQAHRSWCKYEMEAHVSKEIINFDFFLKIIDMSGRKKKMDEKKKMDGFCQKNLVIFWTHFYKNEIFPKEICPYNILQK